MRTTTTAAIGPRGGLRQQDPLSLRVSLLHGVNPLLLSEVESVGSGDDDIATAIAFINPDTRARLGRPRQREASFLFSRPRRSFYVTMERYVFPANCTAPADYANCNFSHFRLRSETSPRVYSW